jgi:hypothetical protein
MKHYKDSNNEVFAYEEDGSQDHLIGDKVSITDAEANSLNEANYQQRLAAYDYAKKRVLEYPPVADYIDGVVKGDQAQIDKYIADCLAVKAKYPKG